MFTNALKCRPSPYLYAGKLRASMRATGVRLMRSVTSPIAQMLGHVVRENSSTLTAFDFSSSSTPACDGARAIVDRELDDVN